MSRSTDAPLDALRGATRLVDANGHPVHESNEYNLSWMEGGEVWLCNVFECRVDATGIDRQFSLIAFEVYDDEA